MSRAALVLLENIITVRAFGLFFHVKNRPPGRQVILQEYMKKPPPSSFAR
jgi:hypothetical protein